MAISQNALEWYNCLYIISANRIQVEWEMHYSACTTFFTPASLFPHSSTPGSCELCTKTIICCKQFRTPRGDRFPCAWLAIRMLEWRCLPPLCQIEVTNVNGPAFNTPCSSTAVYESHPYVWPCFSTFFLNDLLYYNTARMLQFCISAPEVWSQKTICKHDLNFLLTRGYLQTI